MKILIVLLFAITFLAACDGNTKAAELRARVNGQSIDAVHPTTAPTSLPQATQLAPTIQPIMMSVAPAVSLYDQDTTAAWVLVGLFCAVAYIGGLITGVVLGGRNAKA